jgi:hypothetical protein
MFPSDAAIHGVDESTLVDVDVGVVALLLLLSLLFPNPKEAMMER